MRDAPQLAIVGSVSLEGNKEAAAIIERLLDEFRPSLVISGGAPGIDTMAARAARRRGIPVVEHLPKTQRWNDGFKPRNILIAKGCDLLVRIADAGSKTYGSGWTRDYADKLGKQTREIVVSPRTPSLTPQAKAWLDGEMSSEDYFAWARERARKRLERAETEVKG